MPNRDMGREMGTDEDEEPQHTNTQEIGTDPQIPGPAPGGLGTNFSHVKRTKSDED